jgi:predicted  nucleic acid-binding Zn-ribbon protein
MLLPFFGHILCKGRVRKNKPRRKKMKDEETNYRPHSGSDPSGISYAENARRDGITKGARTTAIISVLILLAAGVVAWLLFNRYQDKQLALMDSERSSYNEMLSVRDSTLNDWLQTFTQIENELNAIKQKENLITFSNSDSQEFTSTRKEQILQDIKSISMQLDENRKKLASLSSQLKNSGREIKGLQEMIAGLESRIQEHQTEIAVLSKTVSEKDIEIDELNILAADLKATVTEKEEEINLRTAEMNKAYLASGSSRDLREMGIVTRDGGFLGLGRTESLVNDIADSLFAQIDITELKYIPVNSRDAKLVTEHPTESYQFIRESDDKIAHIEIKDPEEFWKITRYAVVELKK